jgi:hypothetical protein
MLWPVEGGLVAKQKTRRPDPASSAKSVGGLAPGIVGGGDRLRIGRDPDTDRHTHQYPSRVGWCPNTALDGVSCPGTSGVRRPLDRVR